MTAHGVKGNSGYHAETCHHLRDPGASPYLPMGKASKLASQLAEPAGSPFCANSRGPVGVSQERLLAQLEERVVGAGGPWASERLFFEGVAGAPLTYI